MVEAGVSDVAALFGLTMLLVLLGLLVLIVTSVAAVVGILPWILVTLLLIFGAAWLFWCRFACHWVLLRVTVAMMFVGVLRLLNLGSVVCTNHCFHYQHYFYFYGYGCCCFCCCCCY